MCKVPVKSSPPTPNILQAGCLLPFLSPNKCQKHWREKVPHSMDLFNIQAHLEVFWPCLWPLKAPGYHGKGWRQHPNAVLSNNAKTVFSAGLPPLIPSCRFTCWWTDLWNVCHVSVPVLFIAKMHLCHWRWHWINFWASTCPHQP